MIVKIKHEFMSLISSVLSDSSFSKTNKPRKFFIANTLWLFASIKGRINFLQLGRFGKFREQYFRIGFQKKMDFLSFNSILLKKHLSASSVLAIALDPSYISKAGKATAGLSKFWSGCAGKTKWGLELCGFALVNISDQAAFHLRAFQSPTLEELKKNDSDLLEHYGKLLKDNAKEWLAFSKYLLADAYFSKKPFVDMVIQTGMHLVSRLRDDADLKYLFQGEQKKGKGRPKLYAGKVDIKNPDTEYFTLEETTNEYNMWSAVVYSKALKRKIRIALVYFYKDGKVTARKIYFSTDVSMSASDVLKYYRSRFQMEFIYRDGKQHFGLEHCQGRSPEKLDFHWNAALTTVNLAKIQHLKCESLAKEKFSITNSKTMYNNILLLERFIDVFGINPYSALNQKKLKELLEFGKIAA
jgi:hypothetical protein